MEKNELIESLLTARECGERPVAERGADLRLSLIHISEPTRREWLSRMPSSA